MPETVRSQNLLTVMDTAQLLERYIVANRLYGYRVCVSWAREQLSVSVTVPTTATIDEVNGIAAFVDNENCLVSFRLGVEIPLNQMVAFLEGRPVAVTQRNMYASS